MRDKTTVPLPMLLLGGSLWAIRPDFLPQLREISRRVTYAALPEPSVAAMVAPQAAAGPGVAVIPLTGVLTPHGSWLDLLFGGGMGGVQGFRDQLARAVANPDVAAIVLDVDSPGGSVGLVPEAAADVRAARDVKPVVAVANTMAASGAYYIASQASELYATPSAEVGSVGVYYMHQDWSEWNAKEGIAVTYVFAGKYKTEGNMEEPLSAEARAAWQADADALYEMFLEDVALGRGVSAATVRSDYGEGRCLLAQDALAAGMVDGIETLQSVIASALADAATSAGPSARRLGRATHVAVAPVAFTPEEVRALMAGDISEDAVPELRERLGLASDASDEDVRAAIAPAPAAAADAEPDPAADDGEPEPTADLDPEARAAVAALLL